jgi:DNA-directed RNA polymerase specialized sigma24 family protein
MKRRLPSSVRRLPGRVRVAAALETLEPAERRVLALRLLEGLSPLETSGALKMPVRRVEQTLESALARIAEHAGVTRSRPAQRRAA